MAANKTEKAIVRASKAINKTSAIVDNFDKITDVNTASQKHYTTNISNHRDTILQVLI